MTDEQIITRSFLALDCSPDCAEEEVKRSYRQLVKVWHPDRFASDPQLVKKATEQMKRFNEAFQTLEKYFGSKRREAEFSKSATPKRDVPKAASNKEQRETVEITKLRTSDSTTVFCKKVVTITGCAEDRWEHKVRKIFKTQTIGPNESFDSASRRSMCFSRELDSGSRSDDRDGPTKYLFPDGSLVEIYDWTYDTWTDEKRASHGRTSTSLRDLRDAYEVFERKDDWATCLEIAQRAVAHHSGDLWSWVSRSVALRKLERTREAYEALKPAADRSFLPTKSEPDLEEHYSGMTIDYELDRLAVCYNLACYSAHSGAAGEAKHWLKSLFKLAEKAGQRSGRFKFYRERALRDSDLVSVREAVPNFSLAWRLSKWSWS